MTTTPTAAILSLTSEREVNCVYLLSLRTQDILDTTKMSVVLVRFQSVVSRAVGPLHVAVVGGAGVDGGFGLGRLVFARRGPTRGLAAVPDAVEEVDGKTDGHPNGESHPCSHIELHHQVNVHEDAEQREGGQERHLESECLFALRLSADDDEADHAEHSQNNDRHQHGRTSAPQFLQEISQ